MCVLRSRLAIDCFGSAARDPLLGVSGERHALGRVEIRVPSPTETLFAVIVSHARMTRPPTLQWIVDAKMVLAEDLDWQHLLALADRSGQVLRLRDALGYLGGLPGPKPPSEVHDRLAGMEVDKRQRLAYACTVGSLRGTGALSPLVAEHLTATAGTSVPRTVAGFPGFLRDRWNLTHTWQVPFAATRRALRPLRSRRDPI